MFVNMMKETAFPPLCLPTCGYIYTMYTCCIKAVTAFL